MAIGPVQLIVLGFNRPDFHGEVIAELERLRASGTVRVIDSIVVYKDADGELEVEHLSNLTQQEAIELGSKIGALIGLGIEGEEGAEADAELGAEQAAAEIEHLNPRRFVHKCPISLATLTETRTGGPPRLPGLPGRPRRTRRCSQLGDTRELGVTYTTVTGRSTGGCGTGSIEHTVTADPRLDLHTRI
jgi:hypothetical protein